MEDSSFNLLNSNSGLFNSGMPLVFSDPTVQFDAYGPPVFGQQPAVSPAAHASYSSDPIAEPPIAMTSTGVPVARDFGPPVFGPDDATKLAQSGMFGSIPAEAHAPQHAAPIAVLQELQRDLENAMSNINRLRIAQRRTLAAGNSVDSLLQENSGISDQLLKIDTDTEDVFLNCYLGRDALRIYNHIKRNVAVAKASIDLFRDEIVNAQNNIFRPLVSVHVFTQPFPHTFSKGTRGKVVRTPVTLRVVRSSLTDVVRIADLKIITTHCSSQTPAPHASTGECDIESYTYNEMNETYDVTIRFNAGTRMCAAQIQFSMKVIVQPVIPQQGGGGMTTSDGHICLEKLSNSTLPFVVMTNENQFEMANGVLLRQLIFGSTEAMDPRRPETWVRFCNILQEHFVSVTKQDESPKCRGLSARHFRYLRLRFFPDEVSVRLFDECWKWLGRVCHTIRSARTILTMWQDGYIWGFFDRREAQEVVQRGNHRTFLIRFSEKKPGHFAICYKDEAPRGMAGPMFGMGDMPSGATVKHYLLKDDDMNGNRTLADFLSTEQFLESVLALGDLEDPSVATTDNAYQEQATPRYSAVRKVSAFGELVTRREVESVSGYVDKIKNNDV